jgi:hypothetical protein
MVPVIVTNTSFVSIKRTNFYVIVYVVYVVIRVHNNSKSCLPPAFEFEHLQASNLRRVTGSLFCTSLYCKVMSTCDRQ